MIIIRKKIIALSLLILSISFVTFLSSKRTYTPQLVSSQLVEEKVVTSSGNSKSKTVKEKAKPIQLKNIEQVKISRINSGFDELDRVLGGGFVNGSLTLIGGEPGIGKSTLILQICNNIKVDGKVLYISGEESAEQIKIRADRLRSK